jgi:hypothetical protein
MANLNVTGAKATRRSKRAPEAARPLSITDIAMAMAEVDKLADKLDRGGTVAGLVMRKCAHGSERWHDASIIESDCSREREVMETRHDALAEALLHLDPETPSEVLSLALVLAHQLDMLLSNFTNHSTCIKARRAGDAVERAYQAILRGLIRNVGLTSPILERYYVTGQKRVSSVERARVAARQAEPYLAMTLTKIEKFAEASHG